MMDIDGDKIRRIFDEIEAEEEQLDDSEEDENDVILESEHYSESEQSDENDEHFSDALPGPHYIGKVKNTKWSIHVPSKSSTKRHNIVRESTGVRGIAKNANNIEDSWKLFFPNEMLDKIVIYTNNYIDKIRPQYERTRDVEPTNRAELKAVIGLLYLAGVHRSSHINLRDLWSTDGTGIEYFRISMGVNRFGLILRALRFDDLNTREQRKSVDKLSPVREMFDEFVVRSQNYYILDHFVKIDEMLECFRGRCSFRQYIPNKPAKYGIKILAMVDSISYYTYNMEIYAGKQPEGPFKVDNSGFQVVKRLVQPIIGSGRNITCDNWFTSIPLAQDLLKKKLTIVGTIRKNKKEILPLFVQKIKERPVNSSVFGFQQNMTLVSYKPKPNKIVLLLSTMHYDDNIDSESSTSKPEIITFYNSTKGGVDTVDQMKGTYSTSRNSRRWPLTIWFSLLNIGGINNQIIYTSNTNHKIARREFLKSLSKSLTIDYLKIRVQKSCLPSTITSRIMEITGISKPTTQRQVGVTGRCFSCGWKKNRKTTSCCIECKNYFCKEHAAPPQCSDCHQNHEIE